jgi:arginine exporter protein ArgO
VRWFVVVVVLVVESGVRWQVPHVVTETVELVGGVGGSVEVASVMYALGSACVYVDASK